jgi:hypothetical protein
MFMVTTGLLFFIGNSFDIFCGDLNITPFWTMYTGASIMFNAASFIINSLTVMFAPGLNLSSVDAPATKRIFVYL